MLVQPVSVILVVEDFFLICFQGKSPPPLFVVNPDTGEKPVSLETDKPSGEREVSNTYTEGLENFSPLFHYSVC